MKAWQFVEQGRPIQLNDVDNPSLDADGVIVDVKAAGICHTDTGYLDGTLTYALPFHPITLGHEIAGVVSEVGADVTEFKAGDRVVIPAKVEGPGTSLNGGFATRVAAPAAFIVHLPDGVDWDQAAAASDAGMTSYHAAVGQGGVTQGTKVGIIGVGGLGSLGAQICLSLGADVFVAEKNPKARDFATSLGVKHVSESIVAFADEDLDVIIDYAGFGTTTADAVAAVRVGGTVVQVGLGVAEATISTISLISKQVHLVGSLAGSNDDCAAVLKLIADGKVSSKITQIEFEEIAEGIDKLEKNEVVGRLVAMTR